ncbi:DUF4861 family protein [Pedobacter punctiformis]|uniref:DUF4861 family protein n=1 Tax=Pedobacter punctiformis TaxID=3004097 RepID=A0ABT4LBA0_9SPHI|nr:DUF4861 family protein [Pedobacter sp. HCMS5-2]MCZ4244079.1 DUF4861 family protein [Pedobacter sp. HCMS5-2]
MKKIICVIFLWFCVAMAFAQKKELTLINPLAQFRVDELIVIKRFSVQNLLNGKNKFSFLNVTDPSGKSVFVQYNDVNLDGIWDEAVFLHSFKPSEKISFKITGTNQENKGAVVRAHVRHRRKNADDTFAAAINRDSIPAGQPNTDFSKTKLPPFLTEGPAWENDKVGFRLYFDVRNGKDIWGKTTPAMMMDTVGANPSLIYHNRAVWGMDVYKVGSSLSAGALALNIKLKNGKDSLIRLGGKNMGAVIYQKIADGPLVAKFKITYPKWNFATGYNPIFLEEEISIWGGQYFYESKIKLIGAPENASLVTGFADLFKIEAGSVTGKSTQAFYSYGLQSENKDNLGLAIMAPKAEFMASGKSAATEKDIKNSYIVSLKIPDKELTTFRFYAAWEPTDKRFEDKKSFIQFLEQQTAGYDAKIRMQWK